MNTISDLVGRLRAPRPRQADSGWAGSSLEGTLGRTILLSIAVLQTVMAPTALLSLGLASGGIVVAAGHLSAAVAAMAVLLSGRGQRVLLVYAWALFVVAWAVTPNAESPLLFAACWMCNLTSAAPAILLRGRSAWLLPVAAALILPLAMVVVRPEWAALPLVSAVPVTLLAITAATRIGLSYLIDYTRGVDDESRLLEKRAAAMTIRKAATSQAAEDARVLHDTAINTLGAIAHGGAAVRDPVAVRRRCLADVSIIDALRSSAIESPHARTGLREAIRPVGIRVRYAGIGDEAIAEIEASLPPRVLQALSGAMSEAVQNAAKHSGAEEAVVTITHSASGLRVTIEDQGHGIQGEARRGGGIERSILARAQEASITATIESRPGLGTTVILETALDAIEDRAPAEAETGSVDKLVAQLRSRAVFSLSVGLVGVGIALAALNHPGKATPEWLMVLVITAACGLALRERERVQLSWISATALAVAGPLAFLLSAWAVGFGQTDPVLWQAIAPTAPLLVLLILSLSKAVKILCVSVYLLTVAALAAVVAPISSQAAAVTGVAGLVGLGLVLAVWSFMRNLADVATRAHQEQQSAFRLGIELAAAEAGAEARRRWREAGLDEAIKLLREIGEGRAEPADPGWQRQCSREEAYLRQLTLLSPELIRMGRWFAQALATARRKEVLLTVRAGAVDASDEHASGMGETLLAAVNAMPPQTTLTAAFFGTAQGLTMTLVAPTPYITATFRRNPPPIRMQNLQTYGSQDLAEFVLPGRQP